MASGDQLQVKQDPLSSFPIPTFPTAVVSKSMCCLERCERAPGAPQRGQSARLKPRFLPGREHRCFGCDFVKIQKEKGSRTGLRCRDFLLCSFFTSHHKAVVSSCGCSSAHGLAGTEPPSLGSVWSDTTGDSAFGSVCSVSVGRDVWSLAGAEQGCD